MRVNSGIERALAFVAIFFLLSVAAYAESEGAYVVGDSISQISLENQHGEVGVVDESTRILLFSRDMDGGKLLQAALADVEPGFLAEKDAVYVSDISGMPSLVARLFALPKMRKRPYPMLLDRTGEATSRLPDVDAKATLIFLRSLVIERVEHAADAGAIRQALELPPLPEEGD